MGANAQTSVPAFVSGQVLTAQQQTEINTGVPVFATTVTRDAAFGGTGEKVLAQGQLCYLESTNVVQYYNGTSWATLAPAASGALTLISTTTIGSAVSSVTVSSAFSSTYDNYKIIVSGGAASADANSWRLQLGATTTGYYWSATRTVWAGTFSGDGGSNDSAFTVGFTNTAVHALNFDLWNPNLAKATGVFGANVDMRTASGRQFFVSGFADNTTQYTAFTLSPSAGTITGGTIRVYGYANS